MKCKLSSSGLILKTESKCSSETPLSAYKIVGFVTGTSVSNEIQIVLFRIDPEDGSGMFHWNVGIHPQDYVVTRPSRPKSEHAPLWQPEWSTKLRLKMYEELPRFARKSSVHRRILLTPLDTFNFHFILHSFYTPQSYRNSVWFYSRNYVIHCYVT